MTPNTDERNYLLTNVGANAYILYEMYLKRGMKDSFDDEALQRVMPFFSKRVIAKARVALEKAGFYTEDKMYTPSGALKQITVILGKPGVSNAAEIRRRQQSAGQKGIGSLG